MRAVQYNFERQYGRNSNKNYKNWAKSGKNGRNWPKKSWERPILNLKFYLVFWHLLGTISLKFYWKKNSYLQSFWEFDSFPFFVKFNGKRCRYPRKHPPLESHRHLFSLKTIWKHLKDTFGIPKSYRDKSLVQVGSFTQICLYYRYLFFIVKMRERFKI